MTLWRDWAGYRRFQQLPASSRSIAFYSETHQDWHHLQPLIEFLVERLGRPVCHLTSEPRATLPGASREGLHVFRVGSGAVRTWLFQMLKVDVMVMTMMDLHNFQLKRSVHPVHYVYLFHNMGSTHLVDHENSYDHYDSIFCVGPHQMAEIRRREELKALPPKHLFPQGYPRLERLMETAAARPRPVEGGRTALLAPTWGEQSTLNVCGEPLIEALLGGGVEVILRPHYQTTRLWPRLVEGLLTRFGKRPGFRYVDRMEESDSLFDSDLLICDWSSMAIEYALGLSKPVLFVDVPPRVRNPRFEELGVEPLEMRIRRELGAILPLDRVADAPRYAAALLQDTRGFRERSAKWRAGWAFNLGRSVEGGAREIARIADERAGAGAQSRAR